MDYTLYTIKDVPFYDTNSRSCFGDLSTSNFNYRDRSGKDGKPHHLLFSERWENEFFSPTMQPWVAKLKKAFPNILFNKQISLTRRADKVMLTLFALKFFWKAGWDKRKFNNYFELVLNTFPKASPLFHVMLTCQLPWGDKLKFDTAPDYSVMFWNRLTPKDLKAIYVADDLAYREKRFSETPYGYETGILNSWRLAQGRDAPAPGKGHIKELITANFGRKPTEQERAMGISNLIEARDIDQEKFLQFIKTLV